MSGCVEDMWVDNPKPKGAGMTIIGVDPHSAKPHAVAVYTGKWAFYDYTTLEFAGLLDDLIDKVGSSTEIVVAIEDQFMMRHTGLKKLIQHAGQIQGVCIAADVIWTMVNVAKWQSAFGLTGIDKKERAQRYVEKARYLLGGTATDYLKEDLTQDQAVAALLSVYARQNLTDIWGDVVK